MFTARRLYAAVARDEGQALVEYALILALVALVAFGTLLSIGTNVHAFFDYLQAQIAELV
jgi:Flp pilus assembly pilin Flp